MKTQTFGIEIETTGIGRQRTAEAIARYFGTRAIHRGVHLDNWEIPMPDGRHWTVERDGSVTDPSAEIVSPVCHYDDIPMVQEVVRAVRAAGAKADSSCGIHVHVGLGNHTAQSLIRLISIVNAKEDLLAAALAIDGRRRNTWCQPVNPSFLAAVIAEKPRDVEQLSKLWYGYNRTRFDPAVDASSHAESQAILAGDFSRRAREHYDDSRYHLLNLHAAFSTERPAHTIEFRAFNGTLHAGKVKTYIQLCLAISHKALVSKSARPARPTTDNPAYAFRCWLLQLGMIGDEFKTARHHLMMELDGNGAWRHGAATRRAQGD